MLFLLGFSGFIKPAICNNLHIAILLHCVFIMPLRTELSTCFILADFILEILLGEIEA